MAGGASTRRPIARDARQRDMDRDSRPGRSRVETVSSRGERLPVPYPRIIRTDPNSCKQFFDGVPRVDLDVEAKNPFRKARLVGVPRDTTLEYDGGRKGLSRF